MLGFREVCPAFTIQKKERKNNPKSISTIDLAFNTVIENRSGRLSTNGHHKYTPTKYPHILDLIQRRACLKNKRKKVLKMRTAIKS
jgi:hypothetical protein